MDNTNQPTPQGYSANENRKKCFNTSPVPFTKNISEITEQQKQASVQRRIELIQKIQKELN